MLVFEDRVDAGRHLVGKLDLLRGEDVVVLGLPRGGVPVAAVVAEALRAPLDVIVVRKLGVPFQPELAMGAIGEGGMRVVDRSMVARARVTDEELEAVERRERAVLDARVERLRRGRPRVDLRGRVAVVVDDGIATGSTARVACLVARQLGAQRVVLAVPVAPADTLAHLPEAETVVCVSAPRYFRAVGAHYEDFSPTTDDEVVALLEQADRRFRLLDAVGADGSGPHGRRPTRTSSSRLVGWRSRDTCGCRRAPPASSCSRTAAAAVGTARATGSSLTCSTTPGSAPCCSTC